MSAHKLVVINYGLGNNASVLNMLNKLGVDAVVTSDTAIIEDAHSLILPGVGAFDSGMAKLVSLGIRPVIEKKVLQEKVPILGICLGMQLLMTKSEEGERPGLGWITGVVKRFKFNDNSKQHKIPHMGWNLIQISAPHPILSGLEHKARFYFAHSFHVECDHKYVLTSTEYGYTFTSAVAMDNILGVQFHPEKSHKYGMKLLSNFVEYI